MYTLYPEDVEEIIGHIEENFLNQSLNNRQRESAKEVIEWLRNYIKEEE